MAQNEFDQVTDDERENTKEMEIPVENSQPIEPAEIASSMAFVFIILLVYLTLMVIVGGSVYANYGWRGRGSNGTFVNSIIGMIQVASEQFNLTGTAPNQSDTITTTTSCPLVGTCPPIIGCIERIDTCIAQSPPPCIPQPVPLKEPCMEMLPCRNGTCRAPQCSTPKPEPSIEAFRFAELDTKTAVEWLNMFPPYSANRLEVVTTLLDQMIEDWVVAGFFHRCTENNDYPRDVTKCFFCQDRYDYIKCIMSNNLVGQLNPYPPASNVFSYNLSSELRDLRYKLADVVYDRTTLAIELHPVFEAIERVIRPFSVLTENGGQCRVCKDFQRTYFNPCINHHKQWYPERQSPRNL